MVAARLTAAVAVAVHVPHAETMVEGCSSTPPAVASHVPQLVEMVALRSMKAIVAVAVQVPQFVVTTAARVTTAVADVISGPQSLVIVAGQLAKPGWVVAEATEDQSDVLRAATVVVQVPHEVVIVAGCRIACAVAAAVHVPHDVTTVAVTVLIAVAVPVHVPHDCVEVAAVLRVAIAVAVHGPHTSLMLPATSGMPAAVASQVPQFVEIVAGCSSG
jgi:hypothetical protein